MRKRRGELLLAALQFLQAGGVSVYSTGGVAPGGRMIVRESK